MLALAVAVGLSACGSAAGPPVSTRAQGLAATRLAPAPLAHPTQATLILDFTPNAVHAGIYRALAAGYYSREGIDLHVVEPTSTQETLKLIDAGKAQFGLADGSDVASLIAGGGDAQAVMALVQRPLGGLIALASEHLRSPAGLAGKTVGITGVPSDLAVLDTELRASGVSPVRVHVVTVGFNGPQALLAGRIAAFTGFIPDEGVTLAASGHPISAFGLDRYGGPAYPGLVAFTTRSLIASDPQLVRDFVAATVHGYEDTLADPGRSLAELEAANPSLPHALTASSLKVYLPLFAAGHTVAFGTLQAGNMAAMSKWMLGAGLIHASIPPSRYATNAFLP
ncbi:MAG TPA: ABC transporter substrate-binding protein [Solirubrobacteraceae bacterium]|jgi:putative hydroxymethylpyrimidine transport system substrate-binding protein|nr:ABC transporter substrate-binding protein [Solirubrobacteraceae bacterium]